jgi:hypothetical protein
MLNGKFMGTNNSTMKLEYSVYSPLPKPDILKCLIDNTVGLFSLKKGRFRGYIRGSDFAVMRNKSRNLGIEIQGNIRDNETGCVIDIKVRIGMLASLYAFSLVGSSITWIALCYHEHASFFIYPTFRR